MPCNVIGRKPEIYIEICITKIVHLMGEIS